MSTITAAQFEKMVEATMATGPLYHGDEDKAEAVARTRQMIHRAGLEIEDKT